MNIFEVALLVLFVGLNVLMFINSVLAKKLNKLEKQYRDDIVESNNKIHGALADFVGLLRKARDAGNGE
jgi:hypothetical protein